MEKVRDIYDLSDDYDGYDLMTFDGMMYMWLKSLRWQGERGRDVG